jgi:chromosomal replication initiation ATPase DnaA
MIGPTPRARREAILIEVCANHGVSYLEIKSKKRGEALNDARNDAAIRMRKAGYSLSSIADALGRSIRRVEDYLGSSRKVERRLRALPSDVVETLADVASRDGRTESDVMIAWIVERARQERAQA